MAHLRIAFALCSAVLFISSGWSQVQNSNQQTYDVRGTVINSVTHEPIARALVTIAGATSSSQLTDNDGRFDFPSVPAGGSVLEARRPGFFNSGQGRLQSQSITVGPNMRDCTLMLEPAGVITGQITLPASDAGSNIRVQLMRRAIQDGRARWQPSGMKVTNSEGAFRFGNLQAGDYRLRTMTSLDPDLPSSQAIVRWGFPSVSYPQEGDTTAGFLRISPGQQLNAEIQLTREPFYSVTIPVANSSFRGFTMQVSDGTSRLPDASTFYDHRLQQFRAWLPDGSYVITIQTYMPQPGFASLPVTVRNGPVQAQGLTVLPLHPIPVTVHKEFTAANNAGGPQIIQVEKGRHIEISRDVNLMLYSTTSEDVVGGGLRHDPGGDDSSWMLENVLPGKYWVQAYANQGYVASITAGNTDLARDPLVVGPGGASAPIDIVLRNDLATLSVRLKNPRTPNPDSQTTLGFLYVIPQFDTTAAMQQFVPSQQVTNLPNLPPGAYHVFALDSPVEIEYHNPKALEAYAGKGQTVTLEPNGTATIDLDVVHLDSAAQ